MAANSEESAREETAARAAEGDEASITELVTQLQPTLSKLLWKFVNHPEDLEELVQETFLRILRNLNRWERKRPIIHWARTIASNVGRDFYRKQRTRNKYTVQTSETFHPRLPPKEARTPRDEAIKGACQADAKSLLAQLKPNDRALLTLLYLEEWNLQEIAAAYQWSYASAKIRAFRAKNRLRKLLTERDLDA